MKTATIGTLFAILAIATSTMAHAPAYAEHADDPTVTVPAGTGVAGCELTDECYLPPLIEVGPGTTVTWDNIDTVAHTVTAGSLTDGITGEFDSSLLLAGNVFEHTFEEVGDYPYYCIVHPWMAGMVQVTPYDHHDDDDAHGDDADKMMGDEDKMMDGDKMKDEDNMMDERENTMPLTDMMMDDDAMMEGDEMMQNGDEMMDDGMMSNDMENMQEMMPSTMGDMMGGMMMTLEGGEVMVHVSAMDDPMAGEPLELALAFTDSEGMMTQHVNYDIRVTQGNMVVFSDSSVHDHQAGSPAMVTTRVLESDDPVDVRVTFQGFGLPGSSIAERTGPTGEMVEFEQVPEFGTIAVMVLVVAIVSIVAVTSRSSVFQRV